MARRGAGSGSAREVVSEHTHMVRGAALRLNFEVGDSNDGEELAGRKNGKTV